MALSRTDFVVLIRDHTPALFRIAYRLVGDAHDAEDVVQETLRSAWKSRDSFTSGRGQRAWLAAILRRLDAPALDVDADAEVPSRAGLGSSAALAVAIARAAAACTGATDAAIDEAVDAAESICHGNPSGIDAAAAKSGGAGRFTRSGGWRPVPVRQAIPLCVGLSGRPRDTAAQIAAVARLRERLSVADDILGALGKLADDAAGALAKGDVDGLGRTFDAAHGLLSALRASGPELDALVHTARGAGASGAVIALAPGHERDVLARWKLAGFDGFMAEIAAAPEVQR